jgi:drug/metabolite transporter (DMT)-like permease
LAGLSRRTLFTGIGLGMLSIAMMAVGVVYAKLVLGTNGFPLLWATAIRLIAGTAALWAIVLASPNRHAVLSVFRPGAAWRYTIPASILGTYLSMIFWLAGFKYTHASVAAVLNQTSAFFAMLLGAVFLGEKLTLRRIAALAVAMLGVIIVTLWKGMDALVASTLASLNPSIP